MKRTDFYFQTVLIFIALVFTLIATLDNDSIGIILLVQLFLGPWQMLSALLYIGLKTTYKRGRQVHLIAASVYLIMLYLFWNNFREMDHRVMIALLTVPAWILALHYYTITWLTVFPKKKNDSSFLPHLNF